MSPEQDENITKSWQPSASINHLVLRANMLATIRRFFSQRGILEVETPLLSQHTVTDIYIDSFSTQFKSGAIDRSYFLQTSPEYAMKRLLADGIGPIYQICKAFRQGDDGRQHNPEFSLLEWYRPGFNHHQLMDEIDEFLQCILKTPACEKISYSALFEKYIQLNPFTCSQKALSDFILKKKLLDTTQIQSLNKDDCLQLILSHDIEPKLGQTQPLFVYDFPVTQAALAKIRQEHPPVAERFELYIKGFEIANGFHELSDATEQQRRFEIDQAKRQALKKWVPTIDSRLIAALESGLPDCSGVALGLDRLLMVLANTKTITDVLAFPWQKA